MKGNLAFMAFIMGFICILAFNFLGCDKPPTTELNEAKSALAEAEKVGAAEYAADKYQQSQSEIDIAEELIASKHYKVAIKSLKSAIEISKEASKAAAEKIEQTQREVELLMPEVADLSKETKVVVEKMSKLNKERKDLAEGGFSQNLEEFEAAKTALSQKKYLEAKTKATTAKNGFLAVQSFVQGR